MTRLKLLTILVLLKAALHCHGEVALGTGETVADLVSQLELPEDLADRVERRFEEFQAAEEEEFEWQGGDQDQDVLRRKSQGSHVGLGKPSELSLSQGRRAILLELITEELSESERERRGTAGDDSVDVDLPRLQDGTCPQEEAESSCLRDDRYRTFSGVCNNLDRPNYGRHTRALVRILPPEYDDGVAAPRSKYGCNTYRNVLDDALMVLLLQVCLQRPL